MTYKSEERLQKLINVALEDPEIQKAKLDMQISDETLIDIIETEGENVWNIDLDDILLYDNLQADLAQKEDARNKARGIFVELQKQKVPFFSVFLTGPVVVVILFWLYFYIFNKPNLYLLVWVNSTIYLKIFWIIFSVGILIFSILYIVILASSLFKMQKYKSKQKELEENPQYSDYKSLINYIEKNKLELNALEKKIDEIVISKSIKETIRHDLNKSLTPSYSTDLPLIYSSGLSEVIDISKSIDTKAKNSLNFLMENMPGGSIGIAGPRGSGKSTLISTYCGNNRVVEKVNNRTILPVFTSAPVQYDTREFILHLFATVCKSLLKQEGATETTNLPPQLRKESVVFDFLYEVFKIFGSFRSFFLAISLLLFIAGSLLVVVYSRKTDQTNSASGQIQKNVSSITANSEKAANKVETNSQIGIVELLELKPVPFLKWGFIFLSLVILEWYVAGVFLTVKDRRGKEEFDRLYKRRARDGWLAETANQWLLKIKYQQTFTSGWSGGIKLPFGVEGSMNNAMTIAERQMSNPDIVAAFKKFIEEMPQKFQIIIGIDELDKLESDEKAQLFLNEIKSLFGISRCFFLISVSENAMSQFERRGLPFRDVFDSSFDNVIYVDYLNLESTKALLERRVIGRPVLFFCLSYCLSGGLARDVIRAFRQILEIQNKDQMLNNLGLICLEIIKIEISGKIRAIIYSANKINLENEKNIFLQQIFIITVIQIDQQFLRETISSIGKLVSALAQKIEENLVTDDSKMVLLKTLRLLEEELVVYLCFMLTLSEFFNNDLDQEKLEKAQKNGTIEQLARAKQALSFNTSISLKLINEFRLMYDMSELLKT